MMPNFLLASVMTAMFATLWLAPDATDAAPLPPKGRAAPVSTDFGNHAPTLVTREAWRAKDPLPGMRTHRPFGIIIHHTAVGRNLKISLEAKMRNLQSFSQRPVHVVQGKPNSSWPDVPYHFYIAFDGRIAEGRDVRSPGDSNTPYDTTGHIQIVLEGNFEKEAPMLEQIESVERAIAWLSLSWNVPNEEISVHKDHAATTCPGRNLVTLLPGIFANASKRRAIMVSDLCQRGTAPEFTELYCR
jgi:N-acetylmuramoyl-L-alanine amidase